MTRRRGKDPIPQFNELLIPTLEALIEIGGSGTIEEIEEKVHDMLSLSDEILNIQHGESGYKLEVDYRLAWSRTYLKKYGLLENSARGVWAIKDVNIDLSKLDIDDIVKRGREKPEREGKYEIPVELGDVNTRGIKSDDEETQNLLEILQKLSPEGFERICQRLLRESGFKKVLVTGKSGDGGIDGEGILEINPLMSFKVLFQAKRYKGSVTPSIVRDFRGAMQGRADKGIIITTGSFTKEAKNEALRDGVPPIELIDGGLLVELFEKHELGLKPKIIYEINFDFFKDYM